MGTWLSDKYAEGTIGHRFYAGCQNIDTVEALAAEHARELFGAEYAYAQPHSGIDANLVAFWAILAHRIELPDAGRAGRQERQRPDRGGVGGAAAQVRQPAGAGHVAGRGRPPHPRLPAQHLRQDVPPALLRHRSRDPAARLRPGARGGAGVPAADPDRRLLRLPAADQLRQDARDRRRGRRDLDGRHGPLRRPGRRARSSPATRTRCRTRTWSPRPPTSRCAARAAAWCWPPRSTRDSVDRGCPLVLGGPLGHVMAAKAVALAEARTPGLPGVRAGRRRQRPGAGRGAAAAGREAGHRRHRQPPGADRRVRLRPHRPAGRVGPAGRRHRHQPQRGAGRPERRLVHLGRPDRHAGADHPRLRRRRVRPGRRPDRQRAARTPPR